MRERAFGHDLPAEMQGDLIKVKWPNGSGYLREIFEFLSDQRETGERGFPQRLQPSQIEAGLRILGEDIEPWEIRTLTAMDAAYCSALAAVIAEDVRRHTK